MSALEITLTALIGGIICLAVAVAIVARLVTNALTERADDCEVLDKFAPKSPVVFLGDSLTDFYPVHEFIRDSRIVNRGVANETTDDIFERVGGVARLKPSCVILLCGVNDFLRKKGKITPRAVADGVFRVADELKKDCADVRVCSLYPVNEKKRWFSRYYLRRVSNEKIKSVNALLKAECPLKGLSYVDVYDALTDGEGRLNAAYTIEGLHLTLEGYEAVTPVYASLLERVQKLPAEND